MPEPSNIPGCFALWTREPSLRPEGLEWHPDGEWWLDKDCASDATAAALVGWACVEGLAEKQPGRIVIDKVSLPALISACHRVLDQQEQTDG